MKELLCQLSVLKKSRNKVTEIYIKNYNYDNEEVKMVADSDSRIRIYLHSCYDLKKIFSLKMNLILKFTV